MLTKKSISLFTISALLVLPVGIASAGEIDLETDNVRLTIDQDGDIQVQNAQPRAVIVPNRTPANVRVRKNGAYRVLKYPGRTAVVCRATGTKRTSTLRSRSTINRTQSATSTTICQ